MGETEKKKEGEEEDRKPIRILSGKTFFLAAMQRPRKGGERDEKKNSSGR